MVYFNGVGVAVQAMNVAINNLANAAANPTTVRWTYDVHNVAGPAPQILCFATPGPWVLSPNAAAPRGGIGWTQWLQSC